LVFGEHQTMLSSQQSFEVVAREWHQNRLNNWSEIHAKKLMKSFEADVFPKIGLRPAHA
jgi:hypothetical protein